MLSRVTRTTAESLISKKSTEPFGKGVRTRRQFLRDATLVAAGASAARCFPSVGGKWPKQRDGCAPSTSPTPVDGAARVVEVLDDLSVGASPANQIQADRVQPMLDRALLEFTAGAATPWQQVFPDYVPGMRIGLKVNCLNRYLPTSMPVVQALIAVLKRDLAIPGSDIVVWDRRLDELTRSGFTADALGVQVLGTVNSTTDAGGPGYEESYCPIVGTKSARLSRILTELTDVTINCPVLKAHEVSGVTAALKNVYGVIDNPGDFHGDLNTALPAIYGLAPVRERFRFVVLDALVAVILGGTASQSDLTPKRIVVAKDPLALDNYALGLVNEMRAAEGSMLPIPSLLTGWLANAQALGIGAGTADLVPIVI